MLYLIIIGRLFSFATSSNYYLLSKESNWEESNFGTQIATQYREDKTSMGVFSLEYTGKNIDDVFRFRGGVLATSEGSVIFSFGTSKEIFLDKNFFISTHFLPSFSIVNNKDKKNSTTGLKFNIAIEGGYMLSLNTAISLEWRHLSSNYTTMPNVAIDSIGIKIKYSF